MHRNKGRQPMIGVAACGTRFASFIDAQKRMPLQRLDLAVEPAGRQSAIRQDDHRPLSGDRSIQTVQQGDPVGLPGSGFACWHDAPCHWNGTTAIEHTDTEHRKAI